MPFLERERRLLASLSSSLGCRPAPPPWADLLGSVADVVEGPVGLAREGVSLAGDVTARPRVEVGDLVLCGDVPPDLLPLVEAMLRLALAQERAWREERTLLHDIRGFLAVALGDCELLESGASLSARQQRSVSRIRRQLGRILQSVDVHRERMR